MTADNTLGKLTIGLGGQRCGSTWLHTQLAGHPELALPGDLKEVHFFDTHWARGLDWYDGLYAEGGDRLRWESTPRYLYIPKARDRMRDSLTDPKFIVLLRDPPARSLSHYRRYIANTDPGASFAQARANRRNILRYSRYSDFLPAYFDAFGRESFLVRFYEDIRTRPAELLREVTDFIGIAPAEVAQEALTRRVNEAPVPRFPTLHKRVEKTKRMLNRSGMGTVVDIARASGVRKLLTGDKANHTPPPLTEEDVQLLSDLRSDEITALAALDIDASHWANAPLPGMKG